MERAEDRFVRFSALSNFLTKEVIFMRSIFREGDCITFMGDEPRMITAACRIVQMMAGHGYKTDSYTTGHVTVLTTTVECKRWERGERRLLQQEAIRLLSQSLSLCGLPA